MALIVQKYGGTSVKDVDRVKHVAQHIKSFRDAGHDMIITVSAPSGVTDKLIDMTKKFDKRPPTREMDVLLSTGEQISIALLAMALNDLGIPSVSMTGSQMGIMTTDAHMKARINYIKTDKIRKELDAGKVIIVAGFQGITEEGEITTLGRGGSDTTAVAVAAATGADLCEIYTDVDGVYTADPRMVQNTQKLAMITHDEMLELASLGAKVLHPRSVEIAKMHGVKLSVRSSYETSKEGTFVVNRDQLEKEFVVTGVACDQKVAKIGIFDLEDKPGSATKVFQALADANVNVDMIVQSAMRNNMNDIAFTVPLDEVDNALEVLHELKDKMSMSDIVSSTNVAKVSIVGAGMVSSTGVAAKMFSVLAQNEINIQMISTSEIKVSCIIEKENDTPKKAMQALHDAFELDKING
ncbi:MAG: aspartate kinase [Peptococcaceae bacterium]|jgi:aspartate kinase|nr:aspartate kinase [Peptococcaceae bacterium]MBQ2015111.1 aspartate kinase [Peptococcaceae bacterium]MBQ2036218.1 aspartate kinase [Peptococcaceae bacterium]MBQ2449227.1 aspartate kinase [Peptococcaceae bacterium]MBQ5652256.1 aspartate kinase [Peptococcaceae bacterium]